MTERKQKFTDGPYVCEQDGHYGVQPRLFGGGRLIAVFGNTETHRQDCWDADALLSFAAFNAATRLEDVGFDAQRTIERLPEIMEALQKQTDVLDAFCTSVDYWSEDIGGEPLPSDLLPTLGPPNDEALELLTACRKDSND